MMIKKILLKKKLRAQREGNMREFADATNKLGDLLYNEGRLDEAIAEYTDEVRACEILDDKLACSVAHRKIGEIHLDRAQYTEALNHHKLYLEGAQELCNEQEEQRAYTTLGRTYFCFAESLPDGSIERTEALEQAEIANTKSIRSCARLKDIGAEEMSTMRARGLLNMGLVYEAQAKFDRAIEYCGMTVKICIKNKLREDLHKAYSALGGIHEKWGRAELALENFELAAKVEGIDDTLKAESKMAKARLYLKKGDWVTARKILVTLYPMRTLPKPIRKELEKLLRIAVTLCRGEEKLTSSNLQSKKYKLYEELGDAAVAAYCFEKALEYYRQMLSSAEEAGSNKSISDALVSLAKTLQDTGCHEEAISYARRELELCKDPREACRSALFLADLLISTKASDSEIRHIYDSTLAKARSCKDLSLEASVLKEYLNYLDEHDHEDDKGIAKMLQQLSETVEESESEKDEGETPEVGADICLDDLSDLEQSEEQKSSRSTRARTSQSSRRAMMVKKNEKGETRLHVECIQGNVQNVEKLLANHHPVNVKDNYGWTPLHEAANHDFVEIVELLLKAGANINAAPPEGLTPLIDAASCGNFAVMNLLMKNGADIHARTNSGETALDALEGWKARVEEELTYEQEAEYKYVRQQLVSNGLVAKKCNAKNDPRVNRNGFVDDESESDTDDAATVSRDHVQSVGEDYKQTIAKLRNRGAQLGPLTKASSSHKITAPLLDSEQVLVDDWLEDDMGGYLNKKKARSSDPLPPVKRKTSTTAPTDEVRMKRQRLGSDDIINPGILDEESCNSTESELVEIRPPEKRKKRSKQTSLFRAGFSRDLSSHSPSPSNSRSPSPVFLRRSKSGLSKSHTEEVQLQVLIEERLLNLHLQVTDSERVTVENIIREVAEKFQQNTGCTPQINLVAPDGEIITSQHTIDALLPARNTLVLTSNIIDMKVPSISNRYTKICQASNVAVEEAMMKSLKTCENTSKFRLQSRATSDLEVSVLLKSLEYESSLQVLHLSGGILHGFGDSINKSVERLSSLQELYLRGCDIDNNCLSQIEKLPPQIKVLDLSYNPLGKEAPHILFDLLSPLKKLQTLNLSSCELETIQPGTTNPGLIVLDISWNRIGGQGLRSLLQYHMVTLNIAGTIDSEKSSSVTELLSHPRFSLETLESLDLSFCDLSDLDITNIMGRTPNLANLVVAGNPRLSTRSLTKVLQHEPTLSRVDMSGCFEISEPPDPSLRILNPDVCTLIISTKSTYEKSWLKLWRGHGTTLSLPHNIVIFRSAENDQLHLNNFD